MATLNELEQALHNAHAAGDTEAATHLASEYQVLKNQSLSKAGTSIGERFVQGAIEPMEGLTQAVTRALPENMNIHVPYTDINVTPKQIAQFGEQKRAEQEARNKAAGIQTNVAGALGNIVSPINAIVAARNPILGGAIGGVLSPAKSQSDESFWPSKASQIETGAALGGVFGAGSKVAQGLIGGVTPNKYAELLRKEGVTLTPGQLIGGRANTLESKLESLPIVGDAIANARRKGYEEFNKAAINRAVAPVGEKVEKIGNEGIAEAGNILSNKYNELLPKISFIPDEKFASDMQRIKSYVSDLPDTEQKAFNQILSRIQSQQGQLGEMNGRAFKNVESELSREASDFSGAASTYERKLGSHLNDLLTAYRDVLPRVNPDYKSELKDINKGWSVLTRLETAGQKELKEGIFTPAQLSQAVRQQDKTVRNRATARGEALLQDLAQAGGNVLPSQYPDSGTTGRMIMDAMVAGSIPVSPGLAIGLGAGAAPYLGREATQYLMTRRPEVAKQAAEILRRTAKYPVAANPYLINESGE